MSLIGEKVALADPLDRLASTIKDIGAIKLEIDRGAVQKNQIEKMAGNAVNSS